MPRTSGGKSNSIEGLEQRGKPARMGSAGQFGLSSFGFSFWLLRFGQYSVSFVHCAFKFLG